MKTCTGSLNIRQLLWLTRKVPGFVLAQPYSSALPAPADDAAKASPPLNPKLVAAQLAHASALARPRFFKPRKRKVRR